MIKYLKLTWMRFSFILLMICFTFQSCSIINIITEEDVTNSSKRFKIQLNNFIDKDLYSPLLILKQTFIKEVTPKSVDQYKAYVLVKLKNESFKLDKKVFIIVDNEPFQVNVDHIDSETVNIIEEKRKDILTSDSTKVSVVTGYEENQSKNYMMMYLIDNSIIEKIKTSKEVLLRYYAGPDMITLKLFNYDLKHLKKLIDTI